MKQKIGFSLLFVAVLVLAFIPDKQNDPMLPLEEGVTSIVLMGDSTVGLWKDETGVAYLLQEKINKPCYNFAIGGTCMANINWDYRTDFYYNDFSVVHLCEVIANRDFRTLQNGAEQMPLKKADMNSVILDLQNVDLNKTEYLFLAQGLNDYMIQVPPTAENEGDIYTYEGALEAGIKDLLSVNPEIKIVILGPSYNLFLEEVQNGERTLEYSFEEYLEVGKKVADKYDLGYIDIFEEFVVDETNVDKYMELDHIHFNEEGREIYASILADYILNQE